MRRKAGVSTTDFALVLVLASFAASAEQIDAVLGEPAAGTPLVSPGLKLAGASRGELLLGELRCTACHRAEREVEERLFVKQAPLLGRVGSRATPEHLRAFLKSPQTEKPGTPMPDLLHGLEAGVRAETVEDLVHFLSSLRSAEAPVATAADAFEIERGKSLYHKLGCVACHAPREPSIAAASSAADDALDPKLRRLLEEEKGRVEDRPSVPLGTLWRKTTVDELSRFLQDPLKTRPSGRMPSLRLTAPEARAIAMYLLREQLTSIDALPVPVTGLRYAYHEGRFQRTDDFAGGEPRATGTTAAIGIKPRLRDHLFGLVFTGRIHLDAAGSYTFTLRSDDGSRLWIGEKLVVDHDGVHSMSEKKGSLELPAGDHPLRVAYFEHEGDRDLQVLYEGPGVKRQEVPSRVLTSLGQPMRPPGAEDFRPDAARVERGRRLFATLGCASCHEMGEGMPPLASELRAKQLRGLDPLSGDGCLGPAARASLPRFTLPEAEREDLRRALRSLAAAPARLSAGERVERALAAFNCHACHARGGRGGPGAKRGAYFAALVEADLGEEGRLPPTLDGVGAKLRQPWLRQVLLQGEGSRPYVATRMPSFGEPNVGWLVEALAEADGAADEREAARSADLVNAGRTLVGAQGFSCIACHSYGPYASLGIPGPDLTQLTRRIRQDWFRRFLLEPRSFKPWTRMPEFWPGGQSVKREVLDGDTERQMAAIWAFLSKGLSAQLPHGLQRVNMELVPDDEPLIYRHFIKGAGARAIAVGYPGELNLAFDANDLRLAMVWRGGFIDASRHRSGRGEGFEPPVGKEIDHLPEGPPFAVLDGPAVPWPGETGRMAGYRMRGYRLDPQRRPTFLYSFGEVEVEDFPLPVEKDGALALSRTLTLRSPRNVERLWFRAALASRIEGETEGAYRVDGRLRLRFELPPGSARPVVRSSGGRSELLIPLAVGEGTARVVEEFSW